MPQKRKTSKKFIIRRICVFAVFALVIAGVIAGAASLVNKKINKNTKPSDSSASQISEPEEPYVVSTAKIGSSGDILIHTPLLSNAKQSDGSYNFDNIFEYITPYYNKYDFMVMNLEVTFGDATAGKYDGFPLFNTPASLADSLKKAGVDMLLTANNHTYDTGYNGMLNTVRVLKEKNMAYIGTRENTDEPLYKIQDVNGIKIATAVYTYSTTPEAGRKALNGAKIRKEANDLVATFDYNKLDEFYAEAKAALDDMKSKGAQASIIYVHWGNEYQRTPTSDQKEMAQKLCDMGWDVIVGGHPHVIQPFETLTGENGNTSVCIYSMGNAVSNQRKEIMDSDNYSGHTEDGMIFEVEFEKWSTGEVKLKDVNILPTWVNYTSVGSRRVYRIVALDTNVSDWNTLGINRLADAKASYNRTMKLVGSGLNAYRTAHGLSEVPLTVD